MVVRKISNTGGVFTNNKSIKIRLVTGITILIFCMCITPSIAVDIVQKSFTPISKGNTLYVGGIGPGNYTKIQYAIDNASDGDTVFVYDDSSPYYENIVVYKSINLVGEIIDLFEDNTYTTVIDGNYSGDVVFVSANWVNISRFTIRNSGDNAGVSGVKIFSSNNTIKHNIIINNRQGVHFGYDDHYNNKILNNIIKSNSGSGIFACPYPDPCKNLTIVGNEITNNIYDGIRLCSYCENSNISYNEISNNEAGINMQWRSNDSLISNNIITNNRFFGLLLVYSCRCTVRNNHFEKNGWEICIGDHKEFGEPSNHSVYHNNIMDKSDYECLDDGTSRWDNGYPSGGNYWAGYHDVDYFSGPNQDILGKDGIGDTPYPIFGGKKPDRYPLMEPYGMTKLSIDFRTKLFSFSGDIKNIGYKTALNVQRRIKVEGGLVLLRRNTYGIIPEPLLPGEETTITPGTILGFGRIKITIEVWADNAPMISVSKPGFLFLFFVLIK